jgi:hypothetical protein
MAMRDDLDIPMPVSPSSFRVSRRRPGLDPNTRRLLLAAGAIAGTLVLLIGAWSLTGHSAGGGGLPVVEAANTPLKDTVLAPPPEAPRLQALREQAAAEEAARKEAAAKLAAAQRPPEPKSVVAEAPPAAPPAAEPVALRTTLPPVPPIPPGPPPRSAVADASPAPAPARPAAHGRTQVQLAALQSEAAAMNEWHRLERRMPGLLDGKQPTVMKVQHDGRVFYRLRTGGFSGSGEAGKFCSEVKAKGGGCTVAAF